MLFCTMPNNAEIPRLEAPQLVVMDLLGVFMENDHAVKGAIAAAFQAHGERVDEDLAAPPSGSPRPKALNVCCDGGTPWNNQTKSP